MSDRNETKINKLIGRINDEYIVVEDVFDYGEGSMRGATGHTIQPVPLKDYESRKENASEELDEQWRMAVDSKSTDLGLEEWSQMVIDNDGEGAFYNLSYMDSTAMEAIERFNERVKRENEEYDTYTDDDELAEFTDARSCGWIFHRDGAEGVRFEDFDELFVPLDDPVFALIDQYEKWTISEDGVMREANSTYSKRLKSAYSNPFVDPRNAKIYLNAIEIAAEYKGMYVDDDGDAHTLVDIYVKDGLCYVSGQGQPIGQLQRESIEYIKTMFYSAYVNAVEDMKRIETAEQKDADIDERECCKNNEE